MSVVLESFWTQLWIFFLNGALYLKRRSTYYHFLDERTGYHTTILRNIPCIPYPWMLKGSSNYSWSKVGCYTLCQEVSKSLFYCMATNLSRADNLSFRESGQASVVQKLDSAIKKLLSSVMGMGETFKREIDKRKGETKPLAFTLNTLF